MKKALLVYLFFISGIISAQIRLDWSETQRPINKIEQKDLNTTENIVCGIDDLLYSIIEKNNNVYLVSYREKDMKLESYKELAYGKNVNVGEEPKTFSQEEIAKRTKEKSEVVEFEYGQSFIIKDNIYLIYRNEQKRVFVQKYNLNGAPLDYSLQIPGPDSTNYSGGSLFQISQDSSMFFTYKTAYFQDIEANKINLNVWNLDFELLHSAEVELPSINSRSLLYDYTLTKDFKLVGLYKTQLPKDELGENEFPFLISAVSIDIPKASVLEMEVNLEDDFIRDMNLLFDENQNAYCLGILSKQENRVQPDGTFLLKLDYNKGEVIDEYSQVFSAEVSQLLNNNSYKEKWIRDLKVKIEVKSVLPKSDGGCYVLFEEDFIITRNYYSEPSQTIYYNNDIIIMNLSSSGDIIWQKVIPKQQQSLITGLYNSFYATQNDDKLYVFYNEDISNFKNGNHQKLITPDATTYMVPVVYTLMDNGSLEMAGLVPYKFREENSLVFRNAKRIADNKLVLSKINLSSGGLIKGRKLKTFQLAKVTIK